MDARSFPHFLWTFSGTQYVSNGISDEKAISLIEQAYIDNRKNPVVNGKSVTYNSNWVNFGSGWAVLAVSDRGLAKVIEQDNQRFVIYEHSLLKMMIFYLFFSTSCLFFISFSVVEFSDFDGA